MNDIAIVLVWVNRSLSLHECSGQKSKTDEGSKIVKTKIGIKDKKKKKKEEKRMSIKEYSCH